VPGTARAYGSRVVEPAFPDLVPVPDRGRRFVATRRVRMGDADRAGRVRLDALARLLQDVGNDDFADAGLDARSPWVTRRTVVAGAPWPRIGEQIEFTTFCGGIGSRWAERRSSIAGDRGGRVEAAALWVFVDAASGRPCRLPPWFLDTYGEAAAGRTVRARLRSGGPPPSAAGRPWPLRSTDYDVLGHVNNAATWSAIEDECARLDSVPRVAELEYRAPMEPDEDVMLHSVRARDGHLGMWLTVDGAVRAAARVTPVPYQP